MHSSIETEIEKGKFFSDNAKSRKDGMLQSNILNEELSSVALEGNVSLLVQGPSLRSKFSFTMYVDPHWCWKVLAWRSLAATQSTRTNATFLIHGPKRDLFVTSIYFLTYSE